MKDLTLRDIRRMLNRAAEIRPSWGGRFVVGRRTLPAGRLSSLLIGACEGTGSKRSACTRVLDRVIAESGAKTRVRELDSNKAGEYRPKGTSAVAPTSDDPQDGNLHGGDGASGEVEDSAKTGGIASVEKTTEADASATAADQDTPHSEPAEQHTGEHPGGSGDDPTKDRETAISAGGEDTGAEGASHTPATVESGDDFPASDIPGAQSRQTAARLPDETATLPSANYPTFEEVASLESANDRMEAMDTHSHAGGFGSPSCTPRVEYGGCHARLEELRDGARSRREKRAARRLARRLTRLFASWSVGGLDESPRLDSRRLVEHLVSRRGQLSRCVRREKQRQIILLLADVSGSCSAHAADTVAAIATVALHDDRVVLVTHSNGIPLEIFGGRTGERWELPETNDLDVTWWESLVIHHAVAGTIAFGDWDALKVYELLAKLGPLVWLDSDAKQAGVKNRTKTIKGVCAQALSKITYITGVGGAVTADEALRQLHTV